MEETNFSFAIFITLHGKNVAAVRGEAYMKFLRGEEIKQKPLQEHFWTDNHQTFE